jgi:hypothetical protein
MPSKATLLPIVGGYLLEVGLADGRVRALLPTDDSATLTAAGLSTTGNILVQRLTTDGNVTETVTASQ